MTDHYEDLSGWTPSCALPTNAASGLSFSEILLVLRPIDGGTDSRPRKTRLICRICLLLTYLSEEALSNQEAIIRRLAQNGEEEKHER